MSVCRAAGRARLVSWGAQTPRGRIAESHRSQDTINAATQGRCDVQGASLSLKGRGCPAREPCVKLSRPRARRWAAMPAARPHSPKPLTRRRTQTREGGAVGPRAPSRRKRGPGRARRGACSGAKVENERGSVSLKSSPVQYRGRQANEMGATWCIGARVRQREESLVARHAGARQLTYCLIA